MISRFIKNNFKVILAIIITAIICIGGTVFATGYLAKDISYTREGTNIKNVEEALNELYSTNNVKLYDMRNKTTIIDNEGGNDSYNVKKINLYDDTKNKIITIDIDADMVVQHRNTTFTIDISNLGINNILQWKVYKDYTIAGNFYVFSNDINKNQIQIGIDSNWGYTTKYNYGFKISILYN